MRIVRVQLNARVVHAQTNAIQYVLLLLLLLSWLVGWLVGDCWVGFGLCTYSNTNCIGRNGLTPSRGCVKNPFGVFSLSPGGVDSAGDCGD
jgi:hypothetical protein